MTRLPTSVRDVKGVDGEPYTLNYLCAKPGCMEEATDPHHLWRRSELIGPYWWVDIEHDGLIVGNIVGLCRTHHHAITVNVAWINWDDGVFTWTDMLTISEPLSFQPPVREASNEDSIPSGPEKNGEGSPVALPPHDVRADGTCPTCLRPLPHPKKEHEPKRERRTWSVTVPKDEREDGAQTIDDLVERSRESLAKAGMPYGDADTAKFFVLTHALALFVAHGDTILSDA